MTRAVGPLSVVARFTAGARVGTLAEERCLRRGVGHYRKVGPAPCPECRDKIEEQIRLALRRGMR